jgi:RIP metalloprotease RseP
MTPADDPSTPADGSAEVEAPTRPELNRAGRIAAGVSEKGYGVEAEAPATVRFAGLRLAAMLAVLVLIGWANLGMLVVILALVGMITLHEFGHFIMAKRAGIKVTEFFLGFGPKLWSMRRGEVEYGIKLIPAGAYVKVIGMTNLEEVDPADEPRAYRQKSFLQRIGVAVAGSTMHFIIAAVMIFVSLVAIGAPAGSLDPNVSAKKWQIDTIEPGSGAALAGLRKGDRIVSIDGKDVGTFDSLRDVTADVPQGKPVRIELVRKGKTIEKSITIKPFYSWYLDTVVKGSSLAAKDFLPGDQIMSIHPGGSGSVAVHTKDHDSLDKFLNEYDGRLVRVHYRREYKAGTVAHAKWVRLDRMILLGNKAYLGIRSENPPLEKVGVVKGIVETPKSFAVLAKVSLGGLAHFFSPSGLKSFGTQLGGATKNHADQVKQDKAKTLDHSNSRLSDSSPPSLRDSDGGKNRVLSIVGLVQLGSSTSMTAFIYLFAVINVFIGIFNLTPLLPFDGGHVMIAVYEKIQERRLHRRRYFADVSRLLPIVYGVTLVLALLFISTIYLDLANPIAA